MCLSDVPMAVELRERLVQRCMAKIRKGRLDVVSGAMLRSWLKALLLCPDHSGNDHKQVKMECNVVRVEKNSF